MEPRINVGGNGFKGKLFLAHKDDVIYSKIDVRKEHVKFLVETI
jgi:hypothetical protein